MPGCVGAAKKTVSDRPHTSGMQDSVWRFFDDGFL